MLDYGDVVEQFNYLPQQGVLLRCDVCANKPAKERDFCTL